MTIDASTSDARDGRDGQGALGTQQPAAGAGAVLGALLGVAMGVSNALGYLLVLMLSRTLGPEDFGGYSALSTFGVLLAIPAGAFQVVIARRVAASARHEVTTGLRLASGVSVVLFAATALGSAGLRDAFHLSSAWSPVLMGATLLPMTLTGCFQGVLLGAHRLRALSLLYVVTALTRLAAAVVATVAGFSVVEVFAVMLLAAIATALVGAALCRTEVRRIAGGGHGLAAEMLRSNSTLAALIALTSIDVLLARHYLSPHNSGGYALASTFGRAICWGTQFIALIVVPRMRGAGATRTLLKASGLVLGIGLVGLGVVSISPSFWVRVAGGGEYADYGHVAQACVVLGIAWALAQIWLFSEMGAGEHLLGALTWGAVVVEALAIALLWHGSAVQIVTVCTVCAAAIAVAGLVRVLARHQRRLPPLDEGSAVLVADGTRA
ncbi:oligosaccharide flippase family protein [Allobranchiibius sp. CTAmp26]|uniref:oligosaccharide flippase family protein n=1 Tax=Allobranchiibius sp. CTAmp26 TaxID=2815214 RepID=UPI001AA0FE27|nr:oligosaccharide flippase family protein [Allobranchiibius sp. CTAmp26]MBO1754065.1 oligosaccharide flippase family protein [Allobranchiibius sp. CTAmp26]